MQDWPKSGGGYAGGAMQALRRALSISAGAMADVVMPAMCLACRRPLGHHDGLCGACWKGVAFIGPPLCDRLGLPMPFGTGGIMISAAAAANPPDYDRARAVATYEGVMRELIHAFKYADRPDARRLFGRWLGHAGAELLPGADLVVPVPLARWRLVRRQFNQAAILAQEVARRTSMRFAPQVLERIRPTRSQVGLSHDERRRNVGGAFRVARRGVATVAGRNVVLVDDVITTGATAEACARALKAAGAARVDVLALALVINPRQVNP